jgi:predicted nucleic acid-binding protein
MILCDTNILIEFYKANPTVIQTLQRMGSANIGVSVITKAELFYGARDKQELAKIERHVALCHCYGLNIAISALFIELMSRYSLSHKVSIPDMLIAATAISHELELYTLNTKDFKFIPELNLYPIE